MKYKSVITGIGPEALEFLSPELDLNFVIIFNEDAPPELAELAILHTNAALEGMPAVGDTFKLGKKTFEQCAGFIKIDNPKYPLDNTTIHPESYDATLKLLDKLNYSVNDIGTSRLKLNNIDIEEISEELDIGQETLKDIIKELKKPGRDPREDMPKPMLRKNVLSIDDLEKDMVMQGTVRNIVDFGAFVDIGVHQDGLVHISQLVADKYVKHPLDIVSVGDIVDVKVLDVDTKRNRINLSMIL